MSQFTWDLSLYELHRKPQELVTDSTAMVVGPHTLASELKCPICLDILQNTMTTKDCIHRFCQECITTALRNGNKECPTCRQKLISKRSLRPDKNMDELIAKLYPKRDQDGEIKKQLVEKARQHMLAMRRKRAALHDDGDSPNSKRSMDTSESQDYEFLNAVYPPPLERVELCVRPHPDNRSIPADHCRYLSSTPSTSVGHLQKYLSIRMSMENSIEGVVDDGNSVSLSLLFPPTSNPPEYITLSPNMSLEQVCNKYWKPDEVLEMFCNVNREGS